MSEQTVTPEPQKRPSTRFLFVDLLRGWAVFVMIETHVVNAVIKPDIKEEWFFPVLTFVNGLVAPSFLFCAGFALAISLERKWRDFTGFSATLLRYVLRLLFILVVGYSLHIPIFSLSRMRELTDEQQWIPFFQSDILQIISITLLFLVLLVFVVRNLKLWIQLSAVIALVIVFISPIIREMDHSSLPIWFRPYLTLQFKSQFPIFPWSAFLMAGSVLGYWYLKIRRDGTEKLMMPRLAWLSLGAVAVSLLVEILPVTLYPNHNFWRASPEFFFVRLGVVCLALFLLWRYEQHKTMSTRSVFSLFGQESLLVYVVHLLIVYGHDYEWSFIRYFGKTLNYLECFGLTAALIVGMFIMAYVWHWMKGWNKNVATVVQYAVLAGIVARFVLE